MTLQDLGSLGELLAAIATLTTLVYLAVQVRQAKQQIDAAQTEARSNFTADLGKYAAEIQLRWFSPDGPNPAMMKALLTEDRLSPQERFEFSVQISIFIGELVRTETLHQRGLLDLEMTHIRHSIFVPYLEMPRVRRWWEQIGRSFYASSPESCRVIEQMLADIDAQSVSALPRPSA